MAFTTRHNEINATALIKATKIVPKEEDRIKVDFPHYRVYSLAKCFDGGNLCQIKSPLDNLDI
jgi:hypothetical protein